MLLQKTHARYLLADTGEPTSLTALMHWLRDPIDAGVAANLSRASAHWKA